MVDNYTEFIVGTERTARGTVTIRACPFCGDRIFDYENPSGFSIHVHMHREHPEWEIMMNGRKKR